MDSDYAVVLSTCGSKDEAETIAGRLVRDRAAACVNIVENVTSIYQWQGKIEKTAEVLLVIKTRTAQADRVATMIKELSSYDCPEVIVLPVTGGSAEYLQWVGGSTSE
ncbi:MAG TPA: divalent-cation tolerance protein CutA [Acidobacteriota bacterium]|nr:divalent-cation tolerance protein CutA [Acidobacteriota bacterium]